jgi:hypothetical protein
MQTKTTKDIQNELELMRRAYQQRHDNLNLYLAEVSPLAKAVPYLISAALVISIIGFIVAILFT